MYSVCVPCVWVEPGFPTDSELLIFLVYIRSLSGLDLFWPQFLLYHLRLKHCEKDVHSDCLFMYKGKMLGSAPAGQLDDRPPLNHSSPLPIHLHLHHFPNCSRALLHRYAHWAVPSNHSGQNHVSLSMWVWPLCLGLKNWVGKITVLRPLSLVLFLDTGIIYRIDNRKSRVNNEEKNGWAVFGNRGKQRSLFSLLRNLHNLFLTGS